MGKQARRRAPSEVFFPWERREGLFGAVSRARAGIVVVLGLLVTVVVLLRQREQHKANVRATRASITTAFRAVLSYRADHAGACPASADALVAEGYARSVPLDAWGRPLRLTCPGRRDPRGFDLTSDGPDGLPFGLDRVE